MILGGEPCPVERVRALARRVRVVVVYGPTEATICASLVVVDAKGRRSFPNVVEIAIGNEPPTVTIESPLDASTIEAGSLVRVRGRVDDREDGVGACDRLNWQVFLGHNAHSHPQVTFTGCEAEFVARIPDDHGAAANVFLVVELTYEDLGAPGGARPLMGSASVRLNVE